MTQNRKGLEDKTKYNVFCRECDQVWTPAHGSPLWWVAKQRADKGYLDAACVSGTECGCKKKQSQPNAPFRVFGYNGFCEDFDIPCNTFTKAVKKFRELAEIGRLNTVFIDGVSERVLHRLEYGI